MNESSIRWLQTCMALVVLSAATSAQANLLTNGSFELGTHTNDGNNTETFHTGATDMTGWTTVGADLRVSWIEDPNPFRLTAQDGQLFLDLTGYVAGGTSFGGVTQTIATTPGQAYALSFYLGSDTADWGGPPVSIRASAGGTSQTFTDSTVEPVSTWTLETLAFTATSSSTPITLLGTAGVNYIGLDNVDVECVGANGCAVGGPSVPEPMTLGLLGLGLGGLWFARRKRS